MSLADNYPVGMDWCTSHGLAGNCNYMCSRLADFDCPILNEIEWEEVRDSRIYHGFPDDEVVETKKEYTRFLIDQENFERKQHAVQNQK